MSTPALYSPKDSTEVRILNSLISNAFFPEETATSSGKMFFAYPVSERHNNDNEEIVLARRVSKSRWQTEMFEDLRENVEKKQTIGSFIDHILDK